MTTYQSLLVSGARGWHSGNQTIRWSFMGSQVPSYYPRIDTDGDGFPDMIMIDPDDPSVDLPINTNPYMIAGERYLAGRAIAAWDEVARVNLAQSPSGTIGDIAFGVADFVMAPDLFGFGFFPGTLGTPRRSGDIWINLRSSVQRNAELGDTGWATYLHELGHALGLRHPDEDPNNYAGDPRNNNQYTVMSYVEHPGQAGVSFADVAWPITPMIFDIQALQKLYGPNLTTRSGNNTYFGPTVAGTTRAYALYDDGELGNDITAILTVWDAGGTDTFSAANQTDAVTLNLNPGTFSTIGHMAHNIGVAAAVTVSGRVVNLIENAIGGPAGDRLIGNVAANLLDGRGGADIMRGGAGNDTYVVDQRGDQIAESGNGGTDTVRTYASLVLPAYVEDLTLLGSATSGSGNSSANYIVGTGAGNILRGLAGADRLSGAGGADRLYGGTGHDDLRGGADADRFYFDTALGGANVDDLLDFARADDTIMLDRSVFTAIAANGVLAPSAFRNGPAALDANDRIVYDSATGDILYDRDGSGSAAAILFATVAPGTALNSADFVAIA